MNSLEKLNLTTPDNLVIANNNQDVLPSEWVCTLRNPDGSCVPGSEVWVPDPTTSTTQPSNGGGGNNGGGGSNNTGGNNNNGGSGGNGSGGNTAPATTLPYEQQNNDGDSLLNGADNCPDIANEDQIDMDGDGKGNLCDDNADGDPYIPAPTNPDQSTQDYLDTSIGLGQVGVDRAREQGINVDESTDAGKVNAQIARSVAPEDWDTVIANFNAYGVVVMETTTTTTTTTQVPTTTTTKIPETTIAVIPDTTLEQTILIPTNNTGSKGGATAGEIAGGVGIGLGSLAVIGALFAVARRRNRKIQVQKPSSAQQYIPASPAVGN